MFRYILLALSFQAFAANMKVADIGFKNSDKHIGIELTTSKGEPALRFRLSSNVSGNGVLLSQCAYSEQKITDAVEDVKDTDVRSIFRWMLVRSDWSSLDLDKLFPELKNLLERVSPECKIIDLQRLVDQLNPKRG